MNLFNARNIKWLSFILLLLLFGCSKNQYNLQDMELAKLYFDKGQYTKAYPALIKFADKGDPEALYLLGYMHYYGAGVNSNHELAYQYFKKSAKRDHPLAKAALNLMIKPQKKLSKQMPITLDYESYDLTEKIPQKVIATEIASSDVITGHEIDINNINENYFTIQLIGLGNEQNIKQIISDLNLNNKYKYYKTIYKDKPWFVLVVGEYGTFDAARIGINKLPKKVKGWSPFVTSFKQIMSRIRT